ncbi:MAG: tRNA (adenosine(37)-N6)-dimethylallyltransferase MiaA [candidate division WOR-3 bacterium]
MEIISVIGPTASGKKEIAEKLIEEFGNKIILISCDSRKIYRFMDIGTAKPPKPLRDYFHLIDIRNPDELYSAGEFAKDAEKIIEKALEANSIPIIIGGTPLYYLALFSDFFEEPEKNPEIRKMILDKLEKFGLKALYEELQEKDPETASKLHPNDWLRITRALEIYYQLGMPASEARKKLKKPKKFEPLYIGITVPREFLYEKIEMRTKKMFEQGLVEETKKLLDMGYTKYIPAMNTIGYKETVAYLDGKLSLNDAIRKVIQNTKIYARRQMRFFKSFEKVHWFDITRDEEKLFLTITKEIQKRMTNH